MNKEGLGLLGLDTLIRAAFLRPVHIVRQTFPLCKTQRKAGQRRIAHTPIGITNPYVLICGYAAMRFDRNKV
jgi:hypothetical protein